MLGFDSAISAKSVLPSKSGNLQAVDYHRFRL
jgi:hypothetical protein